MYNDGGVEKPSAQKPKQDSSDWLRPLEDRKSGRVGGRGQTGMRYVG